MCLRPQVFRNVGCARKGEGMQKIAVVTGASSGIGKEIARELARRGYRLGLVCRNPVRARAAVEDIVASTPGAEVEPFEADLSVLADVRRVADRLRERYEWIDVLVNNAGVHHLRAKVSADGYDRMIATNHLGPFLLTNLLLERLTQATPSRVVVVTSEMHRRAGRLDVERFAEPGTYGALGSMRVYARSKLLNILFAEELAERVKQVFDVPCLRIVGDLDRLVQKVAVLGGSGSRYVSAACLKGADVFITGDIDYHTALDALADGIALIDPGHNAEKIMKKRVAEYLQAELAAKRYDTRVSASQVNTEPFRFM